MTKLQLFTDKMAISLSFLCIAHCLLLPMILILLPSIAGLLAFDDELFHRWLIYAVLPISVIALLMGYLHHRQNNVFITGSVGLVVLISVQFLTASQLGKYGEVILTLLGSCIIAYGHLRNYQLRCKKPHCTPTQQP